MANVWTHLRDCVMRAIVNDLTHFLGGVFARMQ